jgi:hypothetical protein
MNRTDTPAAGIAPLFASGMAAVAIVGRRPKLIVSR